jgi:hypothetical protein
MTVRISKEEVDRVVTLIERDVNTTEQPGHGRMIRSMAEGLAHIFNENADLEEEDGDIAETWDFDYFVERVVEDVQQWFHDNFTDTTWPRCPLHEHHPLWLIGGTWTCDKAHSSFGKLGELNVPHN